MTVVTTAATEGMDIPTDAGQSAAAAVARVLIVDDSLLQRQMLQEMLGSAGYRIVSACDGPDALELYRREQPELVILDIVMPALTGIDVAREIRRSEIDGGFVPIIFITGMDDEGYLQQCVEVGGDDFIRKPFNPVLLQAKVGSLLRFRRLYEEQLEQKRCLQKFQQAAAQEQEVAAAMYNNILHAGFLEAPNLRYSLSPMALFNGDVLLSAKSPGNQLYCLLGDFTGHGISASVGAGPARKFSTAWCKRVSARWRSCTRSTGNCTSCCRSICFWRRRWPLSIPKHGR